MLKVSKNVMTLNDNSSKMNMLNKNKKMLKYLNIFLELNMSCYSRIRN